MNNVNARKTFRIIEVLLWIIFLLGWAIYTNNKWNDSMYGFSSTIISVLFYITTVYINSAWLMPRFFKKGSIAMYILYAVIILLAIILLRAWVEKLVLMPQHKRFYDMQSPHLSLVFITTLIAFLFGSLLFIARHYIYLLGKQEELKTQQLSTELSLLKQQVQPHFLFNTLNNIYSLAHVKSDNTKIAIDKLAGIMRYFTDEAPKEQVSIQSEINLIDNYISLEQLRMPHPVLITRVIEVTDINIPPMLLMPFAENLFKHGIDKTRTDNAAFIELIAKNGRLRYTVRNRWFPPQPGGTGLGLTNLTKRLDILYPGDYILKTGKEGDFFTAYLELPI